MSEAGDEISASAVAAESETESSSSDRPDDEWMDFLDNGQLLKRVIHAGDVSKGRPERGCKVVIKLTTRIKSSGELVPSETFDRVEAFVGDYDLIHGVDLLLPMMQEQEVAQIVIHERFAFGAEGKEPDVPPNCTLDCEIHLLEVQRMDDSDSQLPIKDRINFGLMKKERGNFWFTRNDFSSAIHCYRRATEFLDATEDEMQLLHSLDNKVAAGSDQMASSSKQAAEQDSVSHMKSLIRELIDLRATAFNNLAAAQMKAETFDQALKSVNSALDLSPDNVKALFRKGKILAAQNDFAEAIQCLKLAEQLEPESRAIAHEISSLAAKRRQEIANERRLYQKMLQVDPSSATSKKKRGNWLLSCFSPSSVSASRIGVLLATCSAVIVGIVVFYAISN